MNSCIYDFETLGQNVFECPAISLAALRFDEERFVNNPYSYDELLGQCKYIKFDVQEQVKEYGRKIEQSSLDWWKEQGAKALRKIQPAADDVSISELYEFLSLDVQIHKCDKVYTRGNTFDPILLKSLLQNFNQTDPAKWWTIRDTRSYLEAMLYGSNIRDTFVPDELESVFIKHDPAHDVAMDVYRMQYVIRVIHVED